MLPADALQVTLWLKLPVPETVAVHWLVPPEVTVEGEQLTLTPVMVELFEVPPPPPQAAIQKTFTATNKSANLRNMMAPRD